MQLLLVSVSLAGACASNRSASSLDGRPALVDLNAHDALRSVASAAAEERYAPRDMPRAEAARYGRMEELLAHRVPALDVRSLGGGRFVLAIRGRPASAGAAAPLVVIDGTPFRRGGADMLSQVRPADVRRIEVLKDVESTSAYGHHGANGVIVVTTRRGD